MIPDPEEGFVKLECTVAPVQAYVMYALLEKNGLPDGPGKFMGLMENASISAQQQSCFAIGLK